jgi:hypothetical protein
VCRCFAYDLVNNCVWGYDAASSRLSHWKNRGLAPRFEPEAPEVGGGDDDDGDNEEEEEEEGIDGGQP